jgi:hypothetical protein
MSRSAQLLKLPLLTTQTLKTVSNDDDMWAPSQVDGSYDPFPDFVYLDPTDITQGLLMWISIGMDPSANYRSDAVFAGNWDGETTIAHANSLEDCRRAPSFPASDRVRCCSLAFSLCI